MYVMIVYLLVLAAVVLFEIYLAVVKVKDVRNYCIISKPQDDEVEFTPAPVGKSDIKKVRLVTCRKGTGVLQLYVPLTGVKSEQEGVLSCKGSAITVIEQVVLKIIYTELEMFRLNVLS